tara:strand:+ start:415 stop:897 length:483 start_codon:yes stop_codon:yes gene_type:complete
MSRFIDPKCGVPIFMMDSPNVARRCGRINGFFTAMSFTIFLIVGTIILTINLNRKKTDAEGNVLPEDENKKFVWWPIAVGCGCIVFAWIFFPFITGYFYALQFESKDIERNKMKQRGLSEQDIYKQQQALYEKRLEREARLDAARIQANAMRDAFSDYRR